MGSYRLGLGVLVDGDLAVKDPAIVGERPNHVAPKVC